MRALSHPYLLIRSLKGKSITRSSLRLSSRKRIKRVRQVFIYTCSKFRGLQNISSIVNQWSMSAQKPGKVRNLNTRYGFKKLKVGDVSIVGVVLQERSRAYMSHISSRGHFPRLLISFKKDINLRWTPNLSSLLIHLVSISCVC